MNGLKQLQKMNIPTINEQRAMNVNRVLEEQIKNELKLLEDVKKDVNIERSIQQDVINQTQQDLKTDAQINEQIRFDTNRVHILNQEIISESVELNELKQMINSVKNTVGNQNHSLVENLQYLKNKNSADQQKIFYQQLQTQYLIIINFYLFYLFMILAFIWGYYWFFVKTGYTIYMKWFWYLHIFFYPYFAIYVEFASYLIGKFILSWINGNPFYFWNNYTSYPPIV